MWKTGTGWQGNKKERRKKESKEELLKEITWRPFTTSNYTGLK